MAGVLVPIGAGVAVMSLVLAGLLVAARLRWLPALAAVWGTLALLTGLLNPMFIARLSNPGLGVSFALAIVQLVGMLVVIAAGIAAAVGNYRRRGGQGHELAGMTGTITAW